MGYNSYGGFMKKLLVYIMVAIVVVTCGIAIYYVVRNDESISAIETEDNVLYMNVGETLPIPLEYKNPSPHTEFTYTVSAGFEEDVLVDLDDWTITAYTPGIVSISFTSSNKNYAKFDVSCHIGNGSIEAPWYIRNAEDLFNIGKGDWLLSDNYRITSDISVGGEMLPIGVSQESDGTFTVNEFTGSLSGYFHTISDIDIIQGEKEFYLGGIFAIIGVTGKVENLTFDNITVQGNFNFAGVVAGVNYGLIGKCDIKNSRVENYQQAFPEYNYYPYTGGICGLNERPAGSNNFAQINICSSDVSIVSKWVAGGAVGYNNGGVIYNCLIKTKSLNLQVEEGQESTYSYFGGVAGISDCRVVDGQTHDSYVVNCLVYINNVKQTSSHIAGVFGAYYGISEVYTSGGGNYNMIFYVAESNVKPYYIHADEQVISDANPESAKNFVKQISSTEALTQSTYNIPDGQWDFENIWLMDSQGYGISLNLANDPEYQTFPSNGKTYEISTEDELLAAFENMRLFPSVNTVYNISESITIDFKNKPMNSIGTKQAPFMGQILVEEGNFIILKNILISDTTEFAGLFGYTSGNNTYIENIIVQNIVIEDSTVAGALVGFNNGATFKNCHINDFNITANKYMGGIAGYNSGNIIDCGVNTAYSVPYALYSSPSEDDEMLDATVMVDEQGVPTKLIYRGQFFTDTIYFQDKNGQFIEITVDSLFTYPDETVQNSVLEAKEESRIWPIPTTLTAEDSDLNASSTPSDIMYVGGLIGKNTGTIDGCRTNRVFYVSCETNKMLYVGGATGLNLGKVENVWVDYFTVSASSYTGSAYAGGVVGYQGGESASITYSAVGGAGNNINFTQSNISVVAGGIAGEIASKTSVKYSSVGTLNITSYISGGFAGIINGSVEESYITKNLKMDSHYSGGFACVLVGNVKNCTSAARISGSVVQAGMTVYLRKGSSIDLCYIDVAFLQSDESSAKTFAETSSPFRSNSDEFGTITNCLIVGSQDASVVIPVIEIPIFLQYGSINNTIAPYVMIGSTKAEMQSYFVWWWRGNLSKPTDAVLTNTDGVSGESTALLNFDKSVWQVFSDKQYYALPMKAVGVISSAVDQTETPDQNTDTGNTQTPDDTQQGGEIQNPGDATGDGEIQNPGDATGDGEIQNPDGPIEDGGNPNPDGTTEGDENTNPDEDLTQDGEEDGQQSDDEDKDENITVVVPEVNYFGI